MCVGCSRPHSPALIAYPGASDVSFRESAGADHLTYHVNARFPAENVIGLVSKELQKDGWKISAHDDSNPDMPSIQVAAWADVIFGSERAKSALSAGWPIAGMNQRSRKPKGKARFIHNLPFIRKH
jgi:hypothetical protein